MTSSDDRPVLFCDIGGVLVPTQSVMFRARLEAGERCGAQGLSSGRAMGDHFRRVDEATSRLHINHLFGDWDVAQEAATALTGAREVVLAGTFLRHYRDVVRSAIVPDEEVISFFRRVAESGMVRLGIISDGTTIEQLETLSRLNIVEYLEPALVCISEELGFEKSDPRAFVEALARAGVPADRAWMVGDNGEVDIGVAASVGLRTAYFDRFGEGAAPVPEGVVPTSICSSFEELHAVVMDPRFAAPA